VQPKDQLWRREKKRRRKKRKGKRIEEAI